MALNPTLIQGNEFLFPANKGSEVTYLRREDVKLKLYLPDRTIKEDGMIFLTSSRLVFVKNEHSKTNPNFAGVEFPLSLIEKPKFEQPVFGLNYLSGIIKPLMDHPNSLKSACKWNLVFLNGQCSSFLNIFFKVFEAAKKNRPLVGLNEFNEQFFSNSNAYVDPNDPTFLYINEPINENIYTPQNLSQNHYIPLGSYTNNNMNPSNNNINTCNNSGNTLRQQENIPIYKRPFVPKNNNPTSMMTYNNSNYVNTCDHINNRAMGNYNQNVFVPNNYNNPNNNTQNYDSINNSLTHYNNSSDGRTLYNNNNTNMGHYNNTNNFRNYEQANNRNVTAQMNYQMYNNMPNNNMPNNNMPNNNMSNNNIPNNNMPNNNMSNNNVSTFHQRMNALHPQPNNHHYNPAYNEHLNNSYNQQNNNTLYNEQNNAEQNSSTTYNHHKNSETYNKNN
ncbi:hypothetical protein PRSY57_1367800 [Plasmodium reichenowi]|uniref:Arabinogalactan protein n=1 Tax=Plasmodium reichenowi TaxID=5854 RepID=A0A151L8B1_PLARE|nr:hypothetical protein PRSY57_1367800 [Plasmodium reichenowi]KYN95096.1 hypothetical protein PRSY57_1367800 [Plasmodium reichenowi]